MAYKNKEKQKEANKEAAQRRRDKVKGMAIAAEGITKWTKEEVVIPDERHTPNVIPNKVTVETFNKTNDGKDLCRVTPEEAEHLEDIFGKELLESGLPDDKPVNAVQAIWDRRNAQGQAGGYSHDAQPEDYPQTQKPMI